MKYTGIVRVRELYDNGSESGWHESVTLGTKTKAWSWIKDYVRFLGEEGFSCNVFTEPYSYSKRKEGPFGSYEEVWYLYFYLGTKPLKKGQKIFY